MKTKKFNKNFLSEYLAWVGFFIVAILLFVMNPLFSKSKNDNLLDDGLGKNLPNIVGKWKFIGNEVGEIEIYENFSTNSDGSTNYFYSSKVTEEVELGNYTNDCKYKVGEELFDKLGGIGLFPDIYFNTVFFEKSITQLGFSFSQYNTSSCDTKEQILGAGDFTETTSSEIEYDGYRLLFYYQTDSNNDDLYELRFLRLVRVE